MTASIQAANVSPAIDCGYVQAARRRADEMRTSKADPLEPPTLSELEEALGDRVQSYELWEGNWRNLVYRVELASGGVALAKQGIMATHARLQGQYDQLQALAALQIPKLRVPNTFALLPAKRMLLIEFVPGKTIESLAWTSEDVVPACELAGKILARIHLCLDTKHLPNAGRPACARSGCSSLASVISRTKDPSIGP